MDIIKNKFAIVVPSLGSPDVGYLKEMTKWKARVQLSTQNYRPYVRLLAPEGPNLYLTCEISYEKQCCEKTYKLLTTALIIGSDSIGNEPILFVWEKLANYYRIKADTLVTIERIENPVVSTKIVFGVRNYDVAEKLSKSLAEFDEILESTPLVVRKNDYLWWKPELHKSVVVILLAPTNQGVLTSATSAAITLVPNLESYIDRFDLPPIRPDTKLKTYLEILHFVSPFIISGHHHRYKFKRFFKSFHRRLTFRPMLKWPKKLCNCLEKLKSDPNFGSTIFIHPYLSTLLNAKNDHYQLVRSIFDDPKRKEESLKKIKTIRFCCHFCLLRSQWDISREILINPTLFFNLGSPKSIEFRDVKFSHELRIAKEVKISMIVSPNYALDVNCDNYLKEYFDEPRVMKLNDVFSIEKQSDLSLAENESELIYFKIVEISPYENPRRGSEGTSIGMIVNCETSTMIQVSNVGNYIPRLDTVNCLEYVALKNYLKIILPLTKFVSNSKQADRKPTSFLLHGSPGCGKAAVARLVAAQNNMHYFELDCYELWSEVAGTAEAKLKNVFHKASLYAPVVFCLKNLEVVGRDPHAEEFDARVISYFASCLQQQNTSADRPVIIFGTTRQLNLLPQAVLSCFLYLYKIDTLSEVERKAVLQYFPRFDSYFAKNIDVVDITQRTAGFGLADFYQLAADSKYLALQRIFDYDKNLIKNRQLMEIFNYSVETDDILLALNEIHSSVADAMGTPKVPDVKWEDVGGLQDVKDTIYDTIQLSLEHPELFSMGLRRSGVLLYGPPGCGKTLLAKAVATECSLNFISVKGPELLNMYVGQSEQNVRELFERARSASPCVIFFDELDALAPNRGRSGDSGGVMDRVVSQLLAELDGIQSKGAVFVIGATNRPDLLDPSLLRPGRFDKVLYVGIGDDDEARLNVLKAVTRKLSLDPRVDLMEIVGHCPDNLSGADFYSLAAEAATNAASRIIEQIENSMLIVDETNFPPVVVNREDFLTALKHLTPSVPLEDLITYKELRRKM